MASTAQRRHTLAGLVILATAPFLFSYRFLRTWGGAARPLGTSPLDHWLLPDLLAALLLGSAGFLLLPHRNSTKALMLIFYVPPMAIALLVWTVSLCPACELP